MLEWHSTARLIGRWRRRARSVVAGLALLLGCAALCPVRAWAQAPELRPALPVSSSPASSPPDGSPLPQAEIQPLAADANTPRQSLDQALQRRGSLTFRNTPIASALLAIGESWRVNIVTGKQIEGDVSGVFKDTPLREILDAVLLSNGYSYRAVGDSLVVQSASDLGTTSPLFRSQTFVIRYANIDEVVQGAKLLTSAGAQVQALPSARSVMVVDYADRLAAVENFVEAMEKSAAAQVGTAPGGAGGELEVSYFKVHFIPAANAQQPLLSVLSPLGRVAVMPKENRLLVVDYPQNVEMARRVLSRIDRPRPQVRITALIYDLSLQDAEQLGLNWESAGKGRNLDDDGNAQQALQFETTTLAPFAASEAGGTLTVRSLTRNFDINAVALLLQTANDARLLANPNLIVVDNELGEWKSVSEIPYQQITQSELGGQIGTTAFKEAGITLRVRPAIAGDGTIEMLVEPEFSRLAGFTPEEDQPIIDTRKATTTARVANRQTLVLSGLRQRSDTGEFRGVPFLKDVRYIGPLFRSRDTNVRESELIVFIMPEVVGFDDSAGARNLDALETINCRLDGIPRAEGCPPACGPNACEGGLQELPPVEMQHSGAPYGSHSGVQQSGPKQASPMRPPYEARFRAANAKAASPAPAPRPVSSELGPWQERGSFGF